MRLQLARYGILFRKDGGEGRRGEERKGEGRRGEERRGEGRGEVRRGRNERANVVDSEAAVGALRILSRKRGEGK